MLYYTIILYYTQVGHGDRLAPPGSRLAPRCRRVWGAATPRSGGSGGQRPPGHILVFTIFGMLFGKPGCYILNILAVARRLPNSNVIPKTSELDARVSLPRQWHARPAVGWLQSHANSLCAFHIDLHRPSYVPYIRIYLQIPSYTVIYFHIPSYTSKHAILRT